MSQLDHPMSMSERKYLDEFTPKEALLLCRNILTLEQKNTIINVNGENVNYVSLAEILDSVIERM